jgi:hypothetical protein
MDISWNNYNILKIKIKNIFSQKIQIYLIISNSKYLKFCELCIFLI